MYLLLRKLFQKQTCKKTVIIFPSITNSRYHQHIKVRKQ